MGGDSREASHTAGPMGGIWPSEAYVRGQEEASKAWAEAGDAATYARLTPPRTRQRSSSRSPTTTATSGASSGGPRGAANSGAASSGAAAAAAGRGVGASGIGGVAAETEDEHGHPLLYVRDLDLLEATPSVVVVRVDLVTVGLQQGEGLQGMALSDAALTAW